jgi:hypothetical protein
MIGLLGAYCAAIEKISWHPELPAWHSREHGFMDAALDYRVWSDQAAIVIAFLSTVPVAFHLSVGIGLMIGERVPTLALFSALGGVGPLSPVTLLGCALATVAGIAAVALLLDNATLRARFLKEFSFRQNEQGDYGFWPDNGDGAGVWRTGRIRRLCQAFWVVSSTPTRPRGARVLSSARSVPEAATGAAPKKTV